eukprot:13664-Heterococcus_DN1.PRE.1
MSACMCAISVCAMLLCVACALLNAHTGHSARVLLCIVLLGIQEERMNVPALFDDTAERTARCPIAHVASKGAHRC